MSALGLLFSMVVERLFHLHELNPGARLEIALDQLASSLGFVCDGVWFRLEDGRLVAEALAQTDDCDPGEIESLLRHAENVWRRLRSFDSRFAISGSGQPECRVIRDYGMGTVVL